MARPFLQNLIQKFGRRCRHTANPRNSMVEEAACLLTTAVVCGRVNIGDRTFWNYCSHLPRSLPALHISISRQPPPRKSQDRPLVPISARDLRGATLAGGLLATTFAAVANIGSPVDGDGLSAPSAGPVAGDQLYQYRLHSSYPRPLVAQRPNLGGGLKAAIVIELEVEGRAAFLVALVELVSGLPRYPELQTQISHGLALQNARNETKAFVHLRTHFPRHLHLPPSSKMAKSVTHVSGTERHLCLRPFINDLVETAFVRFWHLLP